ncbi:single-stranded-DNA-specific exonuclease RecJ [Desulfosediminicola ganghwensis]|uniref:single-stranded-DNA-specific exonuclease RecJ n=1 Tax=Desulfosediminicola ganghwensis TaxID=2569540 RepID=UPI0010AC7825|nr:single-stranded-DNA-specific exonuclease RecJ [Desulfosediminicola ganghwensis]
MQDELPELIKKIFAKKNITDDQDIFRFLHPKLETLPHPLNMKGMQQAVECIVKGVEEGDDIVIWGDYDVDGTTATSLLVNFFRKLGIEPYWHIPNRLKDGYGLNTEVFEQLKSTHSIDNFLLITVDCGISNSKEVAEILELGGKVIVTDHHQLPLGDLPGCVILNPNQDGCDFASEKLAGVGVAFYLAAAVRSELEKHGYFRENEKPNLKDYLGFVALGTVSDLVEITETNRILVRAGMEALPNSSIPGLRYLLESAGLYGSLLTSEDIGFSIGPRINAAGRLGTADVAVELMTCDNHTSGSDLAKKLESYNERRKSICSDNLETALTLIQRGNLAEKSAIVVAGDFHPGVIGIVASKIVDVYRKPTVVFAEEGENESTSYKGSGRSVEGIDLLGCLHNCSHLLGKYGGHAMAAGLSIAANNIESFREEMSRHVELEKMNILQGAQGNTLNIECNLDEVMSGNAIDYLMKLEPFGPENEKPTFTDPKAQVISCKAIGGLGQHLQLIVRGKYSNYRAIGFGLGERISEVKKQPERSITFTPMMNRFRGSVEWQLRIIEI